MIHQHVYGVDHTPINLSYEDVMTAFNDKTTYPPFQLYSYDDTPDEFTLKLTDTHMVQTFTSAFTEHGREGDGCDWADLALHVLSQDDTIKADAFGLDPEAGMFIAYGKDLDVLKALAKALHHLFHNEDALQIAVKHSPWKYN